MTAYIVLAVAPVAETDVVAAPNCFGRAHTLRGNSGDNVLTGTDGNTPPKSDVIIGLGGMDIIEGEPEEEGGDKNYICGGTGNDTIDVGAGNSSGPETINAGPGNDTIDQSDSDAVDTIDCGEGTDTLTFDDGVDTHTNCENLIPE